MLTVMRGGPGSGSGGRSEAAAGTFTGTAWLDVHMPPSEGVAVGNVYFEPCSRTYWHSPRRGQLLIIVAGEGFVADENETVACARVTWSGRLLGYGTGTVRRWTASCCIRR
jgi:hypothetical protein